MSGRLDSALLPERGDNRRLYHGNFTLGWLIPTIASTWFCFIYGPPKVLNYDRKELAFGPCFGLHLLGSCLLVLCCVWNVFHTPSHGPCYQLIHVYIGRFALPASLVGGVFGFLTVWWERYAVLDDGQKIGLSTVGALQLYNTVVGWRAIRKFRALKEMERNAIQFTEEDKQQKAKYLEQHIVAMIFVFMCCFGPSLLRAVPYMCGFPGRTNNQALGITTVVIMLIGTNVCASTLGKSFLTKRSPTQVTSQERELCI